LGDLNDERKEGSKNQISAHAVGSDDYHARDLAYVRLGMRYGNTRILSKKYKDDKALCPMCLWSFAPLCLYNLCLTAC
jgi:hypothetical protein